MRHMVLQEFTDVWVNNINEDDILEEHTPINNEPMTCEEAIQFSRAPFIHNFHSPYLWEPDYNPFAVHKDQNIYQNCKGAHR